MRELYLSTFSLGVNQLHKVDGLRLTESTIVDLCCFPIKEIQEEFLERFADQALRTPN